MVLGCNGREGQLTIAATGMRMHVWRKSADDHCSCTYVVFSFDRALKRAAWCLGALGNGYDKRAVDLALRSGDKILGPA